MKPIEILKEEHQVILGVIQVIDAIVSKIRKGEKIDNNDLRDIVDFIKTFADRCHHRKEEDLLFKYMIDAGVPKEGGPIEVMLSEHEMGRRFVKIMEDSLNRQSVDYSKFVEGASGYSGLLNEHIYKEDNILYRMAEMHIDDESMKRLLEEFERVEKFEIGEEVHKRYHKLSENLRKKYLA